MDYQPTQSGPVQQAPQPGAVPPQGWQPPVYVPVQAPGGIPQPVYYYMPVQDRRVKNGAKTFNRMSLVTLLQFLMAFAVELPLITALTMMGTDIYQDQMLLTLLEGAMVPLSTALPFVLVMFLSRQPASEYLKFRKTDKVQSLLLVVAALGLVLAANLPAGWLQDIMSQGGYSPTPQVTEMTSMPLFLAEFAITAILVPIMEEFAFRGVLLSRLERHGEVFALVGSAILFSLAHMDASTVVFAFAAGLVFGFLYMRTRNLWVSIAVHALNNGLAVIGSAADLLFPQEAMDVAEFCMFYLPIALGVVALVLLLAFKRKVFLTPLQQEVPTVRPLTFGESVQAYIRAPMFWVFLGMSILFTVGQFF